MNHFFSQKQQNLYDYRQVFIDFHRSLQNIKDKSLLISSIVTRVYELIPAKSIYIFWENSDSTRYQLIKTNTGFHNELNLLSDDGLIQWLKLNEKPMIVSFEPEFANIFSANDQQIINSLNAIVICPLKTNDRLKGAIILNEREDNQPYNENDLEILTFLLDNAVLAIENVSYHEERATHLKHIYRADRLAVIGQLAAGAAHEIRNPLTSIKSMIQYVQNDVQEPKKQNMIKSVLQEVDRINDILTDLLSFSRQNNPVKREFDLVALIDQTIEFISKTRMKKHITINKTCFAQFIPIIADNDQLKQVLINIFLNSIEAIENEGVVSINIQSSKVEDEPFYNITITDNGIGIDEKSLEKIFDPFYTTKEDGTGLGLSISYGIINRHRGRIDISNNPDGGAQVIIQLPVGNEKLKNI